MEQFTRKGSAPMLDETALLFQFSDDKSAVLASQMLQELGYEPVIQQGQNVHIHLDGSDLTSALEIAQSHGGWLTTQSPITDACITDDAYHMDTIPIPAHVVNEDLIASEDIFDPDDRSYGYFSGDVHT
ncbi:hypothetical protein FHS14_004598 [Paenibacillus baekrokdamisoli]|nr:hypothetical protein [Paenibacillus baekrokdamisoli]MBB3071589.1 hypothetical protein [Paenibacillus baekrokdamisoli]